MKKFLLTALALVTVAVVSIAGTVAYLTGEDSDVNVMTTGKVSIAQHEYQRAEGVAHDAGDMGAGNGVKEGALVPFVQGQALYPAVPANNVSTDYSAEQNTEDLFFWGDYVYSGTAGNGLWDDNNLSNVMDKFVFVENTGTSDAYFRTIIAFECPEGMTYGVEPYSQGNELMMNVNAGSYDWEEVGYVTIDGVRYHLEVATYKNSLASGNQAHPSLLQVALTHNATNEDMALLGDAYEILVLSQAVQTEGFANAATALDAAFGEVNATTAAEWFNGIDVPGILVDAIGVNKTTNKSGSFILADDIETTGDASVAGDARYGYGYEYIIRGGVDYTLDLNGKTIAHKAVNENANNNALTYLFVANNAGTKLTIEGEGKVYCNNSEGYTCAIQGKDGTLVTVNGGDYELDNGIAVWAGAGSHIVINGGSFVNGNATTDHELIYTSGGVIDIYGGFFHNTDGNYTLNVEDRNRSTGFINVYGGTYVNFDPSTGGQDPNNIKVADGYKVVSETQANGDVWYTVVAK